MVRVTIRVRVTMRVRGRGRVRCTPVRGRVRVGVRVRVRVRDRIEQLQTQARGSVDFQAARFREILKFLRKWTVPTHRYLPHEKVYDTMDNRQGDVWNACDKRI